MPSPQSDPSKMPAMPAGIVMRNSSTGSTPLGEITTNVAARNAEPADPISKAGRPASVRHRRSHSGASSVQSARREPTRRRSGSGSTRGEKPRGKGADSDAEEDDDSEERGYPLFDGDRPWSQRSWAYQMIPFRGMYYDVRRRLPFYVTDWTTALYPRNWFTIVDSIVRMYFINLMPAIAYVLDMNYRTNGSYGINEVILASALAAIVFPLFAAQPLTFVGVTGLINLVNYTQYDIVAKHYGFDNIAYLRFQAWTLIWAAGFHFIVAIFNICDFTRFITDMTSTTFGFYVGIVYIQKGIELLIEEFEPLPLDNATGWLSVTIAMLFTVSVYFVSKVGRTPYLPFRLRSFIGGYAFTAGVLFWTGFSHFPKNSLRNVPIERLPITRAFFPTLDRSWFIDFWNIELKWVFIAAPFGFLIMLLFYFDHNVSSVMAQARQFPVKTPAGFHWDFFLLGITTLVSGFLGLPAPNGLVPQAPVHTDTLSVYKQVDRADQKHVREQRPAGATVSGAKYRQQEVVNTRVVEQRFSYFCIGLLTVATLSPPFLTALGTMPRAVFAGVFILVGWGSIESNPIVARTLALFQDRRMAEPDNPLLQLRKRKILLFVGIQWLFFAMTMAISQTIAGVGFPVIITLLIPVRYFLVPRWFSPKELAVLDAPTADADAVLSSLGHESERVTGRGVRLAMDTKIAGSKWDDEPDPNFYSTDLADRQFAANAYTRHTYRHDDEQQGNYTAEASTAPSVHIPAHASQVPDALAASSSPKAKAAHEAITSAALVHTDDAKAYIITGASGDDDEGARKAAAAVEAVKALQAKNGSALTVLGGGPASFFVSEVKNPPVHEVSLNPESEGSKGKEVAPAVATAADGIPVQGAPNGLHDHIATGGIPQQHVNPVPPVEIVGQQLAADGSNSAANSNGAVHAAGHDDEAAVAGAAGAAAAVAAVAAAERAKQDEAAKKQDDIPVQGAPNGLHDHVVTGGIPQQHVNPKPPVEIVKEQFAKEGIDPEELKQRAAEAQAQKEDPVPVQGAADGLHEHVVAGGIPQQHVNPQQPVDIVNQRLANEGIDPESLRHHDKHGVEEAAAAGAVGAGAAAVVAKEHDDKKDRKADKAAEKQRQRELKEAEKKKRKEEKRAAKEDAKRRKEEAKAETKRKLLLAKEEEAQKKRAAKEEAARKKEAAKQEKAEAKRAKSIKRENRKSVAGAAEVAGTKQDDVPAEAAAAAGGAALIGTGAIAVKRHVSEANTGPAAANGAAPQAEAEPAVAPVVLATSSDPNEPVVAAATQHAEGIAPVAAPEESSKDTVEHAAVDGAGIAAGAAALHKLAEKVKKDADKSAAEEAEGKERTAEVLDTAAANIKHEREQSDAQDAKTRAEGADALESLALKVKKNTEQEQAANEEGTERTAGVVAVAAQHVKDDKEKHEEEEARKREEAAAALAAVALHVKKENEKEQAAEAEGKERAADVVGVAAAHVKEGQEKQAAEDAQAREEAADNLAAVAAHVKKETEKEHEQDAEAKKRAADVVAVAAAHVKEEQEKKAANEEEARLAAAAALGAVAAHVKKEVDSDKKKDAEAKERTADVVALAATNVKEGQEKQAAEEAKSRDAAAAALAAVAVHVKHENEKEKEQDAEGKKRAADVLAVAASNVKDEQERAAKEDAEGKKRAADVLAVAASNVKDDQERAAKEEAEGKERAAGVLAVAASNIKEDKEKDAREARARAEKEAKEKKEAEKLAAKEEKRKRKEAEKQAKAEEKARKKEAKRKAEEEKKQAAIAAAAEKERAKKEAAEKKAAEKRAAEEKAAAEKKAADEKKAAEKKAAAEKAAADKAAADKAAAEKAAKDAEEKKAAEAAAAATAAAAAVAVAADKADKADDVTPKDDGEAANQDAAVPEERAAAEEASVPAPEVAAAEADVEPPAQTSAEPAAAEPAVDDNPTEAEAVEPAEEKVAEQQPPTSADVTSPEAPPAAAAVEAPAADENRKKEEEVALAAAGAGAVAGAAAASAHRDTDKEEEARRKIAALQRKEAEKKQEDAADAKRKAKEEQAELKRAATLKKQREKEERKAKERKEKEERAARKSVEKERKRMEKEIAKAEAAKKKAEQDERKRIENEEKRKQQAERDAVRKAEKDKQHQIRAAEHEKAKEEKQHIKDAREMATAAAVVEVAAWHAKEEAEATHRLEAVKAAKGRMSTDLGNDEATNERLQAVKASKARMSTEVTADRTAGGLDRSASIRSKRKSARVSLDQTGNTGDSLARSKSVKSQYSAAEKGKGRAIDEEEDDGQSAAPSASAARSAALVEAEIAAAGEDAKEKKPRRSFAASRNSISRKSVKSSKDDLPAGSIMVVNPTRGAGKPAPAVQWRKPGDY